LPSGYPANGRASSPLLDDQLLYRPKDAARILSIGRAKFYELLSSGEIESIKIGTARCITRAALESFVATQVKLARAEQ
jgi:excisionase family DNA binding protein